MFYHSHFTDQEALSILPKFPKSLSVRARDFVQSARSPTFRCSGRKHPPRSLYWKLRKEVTGGIVIWLRASLLLLTSLPFQTAFFSGSNKLTLSSDLAVPSRFIYPSSCLRNSECRQNGHFALFISPSQHPGAQQMIRKCLIALIPLASEFSLKRA